MFRIRPNLRARFRGVTEEEYANLYMAAEDRRCLSLEERQYFQTPEEADASIIGAILWSSFVLMQDNPKFLFCGVAGGLIAMGYRILDMIR